ncbi:Tiny macrocysts protein B, partial [Tetrabaena socialis]
MGGGWGGVDGRDFLQLWLLVVNPSYGWVIGAKTKVWQVVSFIQLNDFLAARGYTTFLVLLYVFVGLLAVNLVISVWVAHSFSNNRFEFVWPIQFLRWFGLIFYQLDPNSTNSPSTLTWQSRSYLVLDRSPQVLDIATLTLLLVTLDCNYFNVPASIRFHNQEFPDVMCWSMPHIAHVGVSVASIVVFYIMATSMVVSEVEVGGMGSRALMLNPLTRNYMGMAHTRVEGIAFTMKVAATVASVMVSSSVKWLAIVYLACFTVLFYLHVKWVPFIYSTLNYVRCGSYATVLYCSILLVAMAFGPSGDSAYSHQKVVTMAMWIGIAPAALAGAAACHLRLRHFNRYVLRRFRDAEPNMKSKFIYRFEDAREVEIAARCCRRWIDEDTPEPEAVAMSEQVIKAGMIQLPQDPYMIILYSSFLIDVQGSHQSGFTQLQTAKKQSPGLFEQFAIFSREQEHTQRSSGANGGGDSAVDLVAYVVFQRNHRVVVRAHREALIAMRSFWGLLLRNRVDFNQLSRALNRIEVRVTVKAAEHAYRDVLARQSSSTRLIRLYGKFLESIKFDPWAASKWYTEADRLDDEAEQTRDAMQLGGVETMLPGGKSERGRASIEGLAIVCVNAQSVVQVASPEAHAMLGYNRNELKGKNIGVIMPAPFGDRHAAYMRKYIQTGQASMLKGQQEIVVVTKTKQVLAVTLRVAKVSGLNEDSVFLGVLEPAAALPNEARAWVLGNGTIIAVDELFCDWLGYEQSDLLGKAVVDAVVDTETLGTIIKIFSRDATAPPKRNRRSSTFMPDAQLGTSSEQKQTQQLDNLLFGEKAPIADKHGVMYAGPGGKISTSLPRTAWRHKFSDPLLFDTVIVAGAFGSVKVHKILLRRSPAPPALVARSPAPYPYLGPRYWDLVLVSDQSGRILHATTALATMLGRTLDSIRSGGLRMLVPEPYSMLHGPYWQELSNAQSHHPVTRGAPPPHSCRSGLAVSLSAWGEQGPMVKSFRLSIGQRLAGGSGSAKVHIVALESIHMYEALAERRLRFTVDLRGTVTDTETAPTELFGLYPLDLRGQSIARVVDLFKLEMLEGPGGSFGEPRKPAPAAGALGRGESLDGPDLLAEALEGALAGVADPNGAAITRALLELGKRASESPNCSWRVGVMAPPDAEARQELEQLAQVFGPEDTQAAAELMGLKVVPAVMRVRLVRKLRPAWGALGTQSLAPTQSGGFLIASAGVQTLGLCLEVELWRADLLSGVLEVDENGRVLRADATCGLGQSGLVLGASPPALVGTAVADLLPLPPGGVEALFGPRPVAGGAFTGTDGKAALAARGGLKQRKSTKHKVGEPIVLTARHRGDGCAVELRVQAVRRAGPAGCAYLMLQPVRPTTVQPGFTRWLYSGDTSGLMVEQARRRTGVGYIEAQQDNPLGGRERLMEIGAASYKKRFTSELGYGPGSYHRKGVSTTGLLYPSSSMKRATSSDRLEAAAMPLCAPVIVPPPPAFLGLSAQSISQARITSQGIALASHSNSVSANGGPLAQSDLATNCDVLESAASTRPPSLLTSTSRLGRVQLLQASSAHDYTAQQDIRASYSSLSTGINVMSSAAGELVPTRFDSNSRQHCNAPALPHQATSKSPDRVKVEDGSKHMSRPGSAMTGSSRSMSRSIVSAWILDNDQDQLAPVHQAVPRQGAAANGMNKDATHMKSSDGSMSSEASQQQGGSDSDMSDELDGPQGAQPGVSDPGYPGGDDGGTGTSGTDLEIESEAGGHVTNYGVGKRFKKLQRILSSPLAEQAALKLRAHVIILIVLMLLAHTATFGVLYSKLKVQKEAVTDLNSVAMASRRVHEVAINGRLLATLYTGNSYVEGLAQFGDLLEDTLADTYADTERLMMELKELHHGVYLGFHTPRRIPTDFGLRTTHVSCMHMQDIWDSPLINITLFYDENDPAAPGHLMHQASEELPSSSRMMGLWDAGNLYLAKSLDLYNNGDSIVAKGTNFTAWSTWRFIQANGPPVIFPAYMATLDAMVRLTVQESNSIYQLQLVILCLEGGLLCFAASFYMWITAAKFAHWRHSLYSVFLQIPIGVARGLATMSLQLEADEEDDENGVAADHDPSAHAYGNAKTTDKKGVRMDASVGGNTNAMSFSLGLKGLENSSPGEPGNGAPDTGGRSSSSGRFFRTGGGLFSALAFWRGRGKVLPRRPEGKTKRHLVPSRILSYALVAPFIIWGIAIIAVNLVGYRTLQGMSAPIAALNVVNEALMRFHRVIYYTLEVAGALSMAARTYFKGDLAQELTLWKTVVSVMLRGEEALGDMGSTTISADIYEHYSLASTGALFSGSSRPANLLFFTEACVAELSNGCQPEGSPYYQITRNGLDVLLKAQFSSVESLLHQTDDASGLNSTEFNMLWATGQSDMEGGLVTMSALFHSDVQDAYSNVEVQQITMFAMMCVMVVGFSLIALRPFVPFAKNEMRRIAELLSQLPTEVDVEGLLTRVILGPGSVKAAGAGGAGAAAGKPVNTGLTQSATMRRSTSVASMKIAAGGSMK